MEIAELVLGYVKVLVWPTVVVTALFLFREPLRDLLRRLRGLKAGSLELDAKADEVSASLDTASATEVSEAVATSPRVEPAHEHSAASRSNSRSTEPARIAQADRRAYGIRTGWAQANPTESTRQFENLRQLALTSPAKALLESHQRLRRLAFDLILLDKPDRMGDSLTPLVRRLVNEDVVAPSLLVSSEDMDDLARDVRRDPNSISSGGALSFIDAAQKMFELFTSRAPQDGDDLKTRRLSARAENILRDAGARMYMSSWTEGGPTHYTVREPSDLPLEVRSRIEDEFRSLARLYAAEITVAFSE
jgi:hypothetical protein